MVSSHCAGAVPRAGGFLVSTACIQMSVFPEALDEKAMCLPSGDQDGQELYFPLVNWIGFPPSADMIQMSRLPLRSDMKAISVPSGDQLAASSLLL